MEFLPVNSGDATPGELFYADGRLLTFLWKIPTKKKFIIS